MMRITISPRAVWTARVESLGLAFHSGQTPYWNESACYELTMDQVELMETATNELHGLCLETVQHVIEEERYAELAIPAHAIPLIRDSWNNDHPSIYGRFDLSYDGKGPPKMLEYNADTPTSLLEAAVVQWHWLQECHPISISSTRFTSDSSPAGKICSRICRPSCTSLPSMISRMD